MCLHKNIAIRSIFCVEFRLLAFRSSTFCTSAHSRVHVSLQPFGPPSSPHSNGRRLPRRHDEPFVLLRQVVMTSLPDTTGSARSATSVNPYHSLQTLQTGAWNGHVTPPVWHFPVAALTNAVVFTSDQCRQRLGKTSKILPSMSKRESLVGKPNFLPSVQKWNRSCSFDLYGSVWCDVFVECVCLLIRGRFGPLRY